MRAIAIINQKGGVGKTTSALNLSVALARKGLRVLAVDMDPQAHLTAALAPQLLKKPGIDHVLLAGTPVAKVIAPVRERVALVPAGPDLGDLLQVAHRIPDQAQLLRRALAEIGGLFDVAFIDCAPTVSILTTNSILAANELLIPISSDYLALRGLASFLRVVSGIEKGAGHKVKRRLLITRYQARRRLAQDVHAKLLEHFPDNVLRSVVRETAALAESPSFGQAIYEYQPRNRGVEDFDRLAAELLAAGGAAA